MKKLPTLVISLALIYLASGACTASNCKTCTADDDAKCSQCNIEYYLNSTTQQCTKCIGSCDSCAQTTPLQCSKCSSGYYLSADKKSCTACTVGDCAVCNVSPTTICDVCLATYHGYGTNTCTKCGASDCDVCNIDTNICQKCSAGFILTKEGKCTCSVKNCITCAVDASNQCELCDDGYYLEGKTICKPCIQGCNDCIGASVNSQSQCETCGNGYYLDSKRCFKCTGTNCKTCLLGTPHLCEDCETGYKLSSNTQQCICSISNCLKCDQDPVNKCQICGPATYLNDLKTACVNCMANCVKCQNVADKSTQCQQCAQGYYLDGLNGCTSCGIDDCIVCNSNPGVICDVCQDGYTLDATKKKCECGVQNCKTGNCTDDNGKNCDTCADGYFKWDTDTTVCYGCLVSNCKVCAYGAAGADFDKCTTCAYGYKDSAAADKKLCICDTAVCATCSTSGGCATCASGKYVDPTTKQCKACTGTDCVQCDPSDPDICTKCDSGKSPDANDDCASCTGTNCETCVGDLSKCTACGSGKVLKADACETCTKSGTTDAQTCTGCNKDDLTQCTKCASGQGLVGTDCFTCSATDCEACDGDKAKCSSCAEGKYLKADKLACLACTGSNCKSCKEATKAQCQECITNHKLDAQKQCVCSVDNCETCDSIQGCVKCKAGYTQKPGDSTQCVPCDVKYCSRCNAEALPGKCYACLNGYQRNADFTKCECDTSGDCETCSLGVCQKCSSGYYVHPTTKQCLPCTGANCVQCDPNDPDVCTKCNPGQSPDSNDDCASCTGTDCETCVGDLSKCTTCGSGKVLKDDKTCGTCTKSGTTGAQTCTGCNKADLTQCTECGYAKGLVGTDCLSCTATACKACDGDVTKCSSCDDDKYLKADKTECLVCTGLDTNCLTCTQDACSSCGNNFKLNSDKSKCICSVDNCQTCTTADGAQCNLCADGYYGIDKTQCLSCNVKYCDVCSKAGMCTTCLIGYKLNIDKTQCVCDSSVCTACSQTGQCTNCGDKKYVDSVNKGCYDCGDTTNCLQCSPSNKDTCIKCVSGKSPKLDGTCGTCIPFPACETCDSATLDQCLSCPANHQLRANLCVACGSNCATCNPDVTTECTSCISNHGLKTDQTCVPCSDSNCATCDGNTPANCQVCSAQYYLHTDLSCRGCSANCKDCMTGLSTDADKNDKCAVCQDGYVLDADQKCGLCLVGNCQQCALTTACQKCFKGFYVEIDTKQCSQCSFKLPGCLQCNFDGSICTSCMQGFILHQETCKTCPEGCTSCESVNDKIQCQACLKGFNFYQKSCFRCSPNCVGCNKNAEDCQTCRIGYDLIEATDATDEKRCVLNTACKPQNCVACVAGDNNVCVTCKPGYFAMLGQCFRCDFSCKQCIFKSSTFTAGTNTNSFKAKLTAEATLTAEGGKMKSSPTSSHYDTHSLYIIDLYLKKLIADDAAITSLDDIVAKYKANYIAFDTSSYQAIVTSANKIYNALSGKALSEEQFVDQTLTMVRTNADCLNCVQQYGLDSSDKKCKPCTDYCLTCTYSSSVMTCSKCEDGTFGTASCSHCDSSCKSCSAAGADKCTSCKSVLQLNSGSCKACIPPCKSCFAEFPDKCITCNQPFSELADDNNNCYRCKQDLCRKCDVKDTAICEQCVEGTFLIDGKCSQCPKNCDQCANLDCHFCSKGYSKNETSGQCQPCGVGCLDCIGELCNQCIIGFYPNKQRVCEKCEGDCIRCDSNGECLEYKQGLIQINGEVAKCPKGCQFCDSTDLAICKQCAPRHFKDGNNCKRCGSNCLVCTSATACTKCVPNSHNKGDGTCSKCEGQCRECQSTALANCTSCKRGFNLNQETKKCVKNCPKNCLECTNDGVCQVPAEGYALKTNGKPIKCLRKCSGSCDPRDINICLSCIDGFQLIGNECQRCPTGCTTCLNGHCETCQKGYLLSKSGDNIICKQDCKGQCKQCNGDTCTECYAGFEVSNGKCVPANCSPNCEFCVAGTYQSATAATGKTCSSCSTNCAVCTDATTCLTCFQGYYLNIDGYCTPCSPTCKICIDAISCEICADGYVLEMEIEGDTYVDNFYGETCVACFDRCLTCALEADICTSCKQDFRLSGTTCISKRVVRGDLQLDANYDDFIDGGESQNIIDAISSATGKDAVDIQLIELKSGSVSVIFEVSTDSEEQAKEFVQLLENADYGGYKVISTTIGVYEDDSLVTFPEEPTEPEEEEEVNVGLIVGVVVGGVVLIAIIAILIYKFKGSNSPSAKLEQDSQK